MRDLLRMITENVPVHQMLSFTLPSTRVFILTLGWFLREFRVNDYFAAEYSALIGRTDYITNIISCV
jgi:hypothetical protein